MERELYAELQSGTIEAANAGVKSAKLVQLANGAIYTDDAGSFEVLHDAKLDALDSIIEEANGANVLCSYYFKSDLARLKKRYPRGRELRSDKDIDDWNANRVPLMFIHPASAGHGLSLQDGGSILAIFGQTWSLEHSAQLIERIGPLRQMQSGHPRPVFVYPIITENTVDEDIAERLESKASVQDSLLRGLRRRQEKS